MLPALHSEDRRQQPHVLVSTDDSDVIAGLGELGDLLPGPVRGAVLSAGPASWPRFGNDALPDEVVGISCGLADGNVYCAMISECMVT